MLPSGVFENGWHAHGAMAGVDEQPAGLGRLIGFEQAQKGFALCFGQPIWTDAWRSAGSARHIRGVVI